MLMNQEIFIGNDFSLVLLILGVEMVDSFPWAGHTQN